MTTADSLESRLKFLKEASYLLAIPSPATAAFFGAERDRLLISHDADLESSRKAWDALCREVCGACGNLMVPGLSCDVTRETRKEKLPERRKKDTLKQSTRSDKVMVYSCSRCNRNTVQPLYTMMPNHLRKTTHGSAVQSIDSTAKKDDSGKVSKSANANSKQRAKSRKGGLQAMLAKSKAPPLGQVGGLGLDLMDFMK
ncbi:hypothetical protein CC78DRAFT_99895 [Lojkania enalia]|uniref:Uncharacterized protein n=1 Tax=Lojkania enalia TaxID=147567 RepID=A0A9P4KE18_9PLEO|nr:hypothetical protein CC78DRAFT_99895 [Didymosphaeria enalia]